MVERGAGAVTEELNVETDRSRSPALTADAMSTEVCDYGSRVGWKSRVRMWRRIGVVVLH